MTTATGTLAGLPYDFAATHISARFAGNFASTTALKALSASRRSDGQVATVGNKVWRFVGASTATDTTENLVVTPTAGSGRWLRVANQLELVFAAGFATADAAVLFTVPAGMRLLVGRGFWDVSTAWTGGTSSAIGLSSSNAAYNTKGDLLGGASGDVLAGLTAGIRGTIGAKVSSQAVVVLEAADTIRFDRIVDAFTAGAANAHIPAMLIA